MKFERETFQEQMGRGWSEFEIFEANLEHKLLETIKTLDKRSIMKVLVDLRLVSVDLQWRHHKFLVVKKIIVLCLKF